MLGIDGTVTGNKVAPGTESEEAGEGVGEMVRAILNPCTPSVTNANWIELTIVIFTSVVSLS